MRENQKLGVAGERGENATHPNAKIEDIRKSEGGGGGQATKEKEGSTYCLSKEEPLMSFTRQVQKR